MSAHTLCWRSRTPLRDWIIRSVLGCIIQRMNLRFKILDTASGPPFQTNEFDGMRLGKQPNKTLSLPRLPQVVPLHGITPATLHTLRDMYVCVSLLKLLQVAARLCGAQVPNAAQLQSPWTEQGRTSVTEKLCSVPCLPGAPRQAIGSTPAGKSLTLTT